MSITNAKSLAIHYPPSSRVSLVTHRFLLKTEAHMFLGFRNEPKLFLLKAIEHHNVAVVLHILRPNLADTA